MTDNNALAQELEAAWRIGAGPVMGDYHKGIADFQKIAWANAEIIIAALRTPAPASGEVGELVPTLWMYERLGPFPARYYHDERTEAYLIDGEGWTETPLYTADLLERLAGPVQGEEDGEPDGPDEITALKAEIERQEGLVKIYRRAQLTAEEKLCREQHNAIGWKKRATYLEQRLDQPVQQEVEDQVEECSRNIRIAIWNTAKKQNWSDDAANSFVKEAMAEPCMRAALAALATPLDTKEG